MNIHIIKKKILNLINASMNIRRKTYCALIYYPVHLCILYMLVLQNYPLSYIILCTCVSYTCSCSRIILSHILSCAPVYLTHARPAELSSLIYYPVHLCILYMLVLQNYPLSYIILCTCVSYTCSCSRIILSHILSCAPVYLIHARPAELSSLIYYPVHLCILYMLMLQNYPLSYIILCTCVSYTCSSCRIILSHILSCAPVYLIHAHAPELSSLIYYPVHLCILYMLVLQNYPLSYIILCTCVSYTCSCSRIILSHILSCAPVYLTHARPAELSSLIYYPVHLCILHMLILQNYPLSYIILYTCVSYTCSSCRIILSHILSCAPVYLIHARAPELSSLIYYPVHLCILHMLILQNYPLSYIILCTCVSYTCSSCRIILSHILSCAPVYLTHARPAELSSLIYYPVHLCILYMLMLQNYPLSYIILCTCVSYTCSCSRIILSHILSCAPVYLTHARAAELSSLIYYPVHLCILYMLVLQNYPLSYIILYTCVSYTCSCSRIILSHILSCAPVYLIHARAPELSSLIYYPVHLCILYMLVLQNYPLSYIILCTCVSYTCSCSRIILSHILSCAPVYLIHARAPELSSLIYYPVHLCILHMLVLQNYPLSYIILCTCVSYTCSCSRIILSHILSCAPVYLTHARAPELSSLIYYPVHLCILYMLVLQNYPLSYIILCTCVSYTCSSCRIILSHILSCAPVYLIHARPAELSSLIYYPVHLCILYMLVLQNYPLSYIILYTCVSYTCSSCRMILSHILSCVSYTCSCSRIILSHILSCAPVYLIHAHAPELSSLIYYPVHLCILYMLMLQNYPLSYIILCTCVSYTCSSCRIILSHILSCAPVYLIHARPAE